MKPRQIHWKWLLLGLIALLLVGLAILPRQFGNSSQLAGRVTDALSAWTGGEVKLTGPLRVHYFPDVSIKSGFELSNASRLPLVKIHHRKQRQDLARSRRASLWPHQSRCLAADQAGDHAQGGSVARHGARPDAAGAGGQPAQRRAGRRGSPARRHDPRADSFGHARRSRRSMRVSTQAPALERCRVSAPSRSETKPSASPSIAARPPRRRTDPASRSVSPSPQRRSTAKVTGTASFANGLQLDGDVQADMAERSPVSADGPASRCPRGKSLQGLSASGMAHWNGTTLTFDDGSFTLDGNDAVGLLAVTPGMRPRVDGTLAFDRLALDPYIGGSTRGRTAGRASRARSGAPQIFRCRPAHLGRRDHRPRHRARARRVHHQRQTGLGRERGGRA